MNEVKDKNIKIDGKTLDEVSRIIGIGEFNNKEVLVKKINLLIKDGCLVSKAEPKTLILLENALNLANRFNIKDEFNEKLNSFLLDVVKDL